VRNVLRVRPRRHAGRGPGHPFVRGLAYLAAAIVGFAGVGTYEYITTAFERVNDVDVTALLGDQRPVVPVAPADASKGRPINILVMGSDTRAGGNADIGGTNEGMRSDTTIIMHVSADRTRIEFVSIPRDSWVKISDCTLFDGTVVKGRTTKFNAAFANGAKNNNPAEAAACATKTLEDLTNIFFDQYVVIDFVGFEKMVDALGGVPMCVPGRIVGWDSDLDLYPGPQVFDGATAIEWARTRKARVGKEYYDGTDVKRMQAQQVLMAHMAETALSKNFLRDGGQIRDFITAAADSLTVSPSLADPEFVIGLAFSLRHISKDNIVFTTIPFKWTPDGNNLAWIPDSYAMLDAIRADQPIAGTSVTEASFAAPVAAPSISTSAAAGATPEPSIDPNGACPPG
jgi:LCP family protein required for cell wall assembly